MTSTAKRWYQSKTVWVNALTLAASVVTAMQSQYGDVATLTAALAAVNLGLRFVTGSPVKR